MIPFPSIEQFRHVIAAVAYHAQYVGRDEDNKPIHDTTKPLPVLTFHGSVKLHGSNTGIVFHAYSPAEIQFQSRSRILSVKDDYEGFANHMTRHLDCLVELKQAIAESVGPDSTADQTIAVFGEWCGGNIQKGVALAQLPKMFVMFGVLVGERWLDMTLLRSVEFEAARIFHVHRFGEWAITIDFNAPKESQPELEQLTALIEEECPAGKHFGISGVGEGIVWKCVTPGFTGPRFWFKTKGERHAMPDPSLKGAKVPKQAAPVDPELVHSIQAFIDLAVSDARLEQGLSVLKERGIEITIKSMGEFIKWVQQDVAKEETDTMAANGLEFKTLAGPIAAIAREWYKKALTNQGTT
ncbi:unnamed protein product [Aphanomyces euteiches]